MVNSWSCHLQKTHLWPSWSLFVAIMVVAVLVIVCGRHDCGRLGHCLWPSWFVAIVVIVCGHHGLWLSLSNPFVCLWTRKAYNTQVKVSRGISRAGGRRRRQSSEEGGREQRITVWARAKSKTTEWELVHSLLLTNAQPKLTVKTP